MIQVLSLGQEDLLKEEIATHSIILAGKSPRDTGTLQASVHGVAKSWTQLSVSTRRGVCEP